MSRFLFLSATFVTLLACRDRADTSADTTTADTSRAVGQTTQTATGGDVQATTLIDPNTATRSELVTLPGMDSAKVTILIAGRPYADMLAVDRALANSLTADQRRALYARLWKPIDLNTAKGEEILLIPGVGNRMRHEFEEYRPYRTIEQFRREMGKYVDKNEVARLEQYVTIK
jgi:DNA uptake protein ComE-like DNA-binding protein